MEGTVNSGGLHNISVISITRSLNGWSLSRPVSFFLFFFFSGDIFPVRPLRRKNEKIKHLFLFFLSLLFFFLLFKGKISHRRPRAATGPAGTYTQNTPRKYDKSRKTPADSARARWSTKK
jgi:hypothetical protein